MARRGGSALPWLVAAGAFAAYSLWRQAQRPYYPDVALHAGLELVGSRRRVLALGPHPGDLERLCGGSLKLLADGGSAVTMAVLTRGEKETNRANIGEIRTREAEESATILGGTLMQLDLPDGGLAQSARLDEALEQLWEEAAPDVVLAFDPRGPLGIGNHPDHAALGAAVMARVRRGIGVGKRVYFYGTPRPNVVVDITEVLDEKVNAVRAHRSQLAGPDWLSRLWTERLGRLQSGRVPAFYTEAFYRLV